MGTQDTINHAGPIISPKNIDGNTTNAVTHLNVRSHYSFLDGASSPLALAERAAELGQDTLALTDRDGLHGAIPFDRACRGGGVRPLHGATVSLATADGAPGPELTLLVKDRDGWRSLCRLLSAAGLAGRKGYTPVTPQLLAAHTVGLLCLTGGYDGPLTAPLLADDEDAALRVARWLRDLYRDDLWLALPGNDRPGDRGLRARLAALARDLGLGVVAVADVRYATPADAPLADVLACIATGTTLAAARDLRPNARHHLADGAELAARFADHPEALANTRLVAARCPFTLDFGPHHFPAAPIPPDADPAPPDERLRALCRHGVTERYAGGDPAAWHRAARQLDRELAVIAGLGLAPFFLLVQDVVRFARARGIPCQGRGSAVGSVVAYSLGIGRVDPLAHRLLFERFLSAERGSLPDIDIDFGHARREEIIQYLYTTYGDAHVGMACTVQTYHLRGAVRDVGKVLGLPAPTLEALAVRGRRGLDPDLTASVVAVAGERAPEIPLWRFFIALSERLVGTPRHLGIHNGGVVITGPPLGELVPLERAAMPGRVVVQWDKDSLERAGLIKLDVLSLQSLDLAAEAARLAGVDLDALPLDDPATYDLLCAADTIGTFQVESRAQQQALPEHAPQNFADLVAQIAIIRPGPLQGGMVHPYLRRRRGVEPVVYPHPLLEPALRDTLGVILYQEQVLEVATALAGFTLGEGDELRRAMGSQRSPARMRALEERFLAGALARDVPASVAAEVFRQVTAFAGYGFPRSHATAFARLAYETCWLKAHHPAAFYCARLNAQPGGFYSPAIILGDARRHGLAIRPPSLTASAHDCTLEPAPPRSGPPPIAPRSPRQPTAHPSTGYGLPTTAPLSADRRPPTADSPPHDSRPTTHDSPAVRLGLRYVRGLTSATGVALVAERDRHGPFADLADLCRRAHAVITPEMVAALIASGACDGWGLPRRQLLWALPATWRGATGLPLPVAPVALPAPTPLETLASEGWATGLPLTGHIAAGQRPALAARGVVPLSALADLPEGATATVAGRLAVLQRPPTAHGVTFVTIEDETGLGNLVLSPTLDRASRAALHAAPLVVATGRVQRRGPVVNLQVASIESWHLLLDQ